ncbi:MAG: Zn-ribbon domain-containing OB-fold protein [Anaerolineae bacterium]|nr:Zn-ribbon domain-containing OB-fold protein [Anaerolineae bacterium]MDW8101267.1 Zn-ribbon domain-containing OB-fold protein [Anaerolineae bacterium]
MATTEKVKRISDIRTWEGEIPLYARYTVGLAGERFFREIKDNARIMGTKCLRCNILYVPARLYCERCFSGLEEWVEVPPRGEVHTFTVLHQDLEEEPLEKPLILAFVKLEGADGGLVHYLGEVDPGEVYIGMKVEAVFKPAEEREGGITDIKYFRPTGGKYAGI